MIRSLVLLLMFGGMFGCNTPAKDKMESEQKKEVEDKEEAVIDINSIMDAEYFIDLDAMRKEAAEANKPIALYFTGHAVVSARRMEQFVFTDPDVFYLLQNKFIFKSAFCDSRSPLPEALHRSETIGGRTVDVKTVGYHNGVIQAQLLETITQPYLVLLDENLEVLETASYIDCGSPSEFLDKFSRYGRR